MDPRVRILSISLMEKINNNPEYAKRLGIEIVEKKKDEKERKV